MNFQLDEAIEVLGNTPNTLEYFLSNLSPGWLECNEGEGTWNAEEVIEHLIECEKTNWLPRIKSILEEGGRKPFPPFDRFAHLKEKPEGAMQEKLQQFKSLRSQNIKTIKAIIIPNLHLELTGQHPAFGEVKLRELLSTWVVHDLTHISQIVRVMAARYGEDVGPWREYVSILK
ncbi:hypothetical protein J2S74_000047 [Evansella vedderi]|uniref:DinB-like domain-containing protein n=1 Tax=Evansella vedderi TaxID=38282 RepID=A0ABT9ZN68_9BACI|nr:DinB family protein [Evansella vedderi]MDQ0252675.1 hypothetical protein [Evansella vedderi]